MSKRKRLLDRSSNALRSAYCTGWLTKPITRQAPVSQSAQAASNDCRTAGPSRDETKR